MKLVKLIGQRLVYVLRDLDRMLGPGVLEEADEPQELDLERDPFPLDPEQVGELFQAERAEPEDLGQDDERPIRQLKQERNLGRLGCSGEHNALLDLGVALV